VHRENIHREDDEDEKAEIRFRGRAAARCFSMHGGGCPDVPLE
jgi:hypothetical protein